MAGHPPVPPDDGPGPVGPWAVPASGTPGPPSWKPAPPPRGQGLLGKALLLILLGGVFILPFTGAGRRIKEGTIEVLRAARAPQIVVQQGDTKTEVVEKEKIVYRDPPPPPLPTKFVPSKNVTVTELANGMKLQTKVETSEGDFASRERGADDAYAATFTVTVRIPKPNATLPDLAALNPHLPKALPGLAAMIPSARVSGFYYKLYEIKEKAVRQNLSRLDKTLTRHNFFDCETVLELEHPESKQKVLLFQGEMDVVADGSDGDRLSDFDDYVFKSNHFQATTSYSWKKVTTQPNPLMARYERQIVDARKKLEGASAAVRKDVQGDIDYMKRVVASLKTTSFLIAQEDPFIVVPLSVRGYAGSNEFTPQIGDYAVVVSANKLLPAIVGDYGPADKTGEASLRIAKEINDKATPYVRPESDLQISYFIFPGSADKPFAAPDYAKWHQRCTELIARVGGIGAGYSLLEWEDRIRKRREEEAAKAAAASATTAASAPADEAGSAPTATGAPSPAPPPSASAPAPARPN